MEDRDKSEHPFQLFSQGGGEETATRVLSASESPESSDLRLILVLLHEIDAAARAAHVLAWMRRGWHPSDADDPLNALERSALDRATIVTYDLKEKTCLARNELEAIRPNRFRRSQAE